METRTLTTKLSSMEKEFTRYKTWSKGESEKYEKHIEEIEQKLGEVRVGVSGSRTYFMCDHILAKKKC